jgi:hypothetical protein
MVGGEISDKQLLDPWGNKYQLVRPNVRSKTDKFDLFSMGDDGLPNTADDIGNFDRP